MNSEQIHLYTTMDNCAFIIVLGICGGTSLLFQAIGIVSPAWLIFDMKIDINGTHLTENVAFGLFGGQGCMDTGYGQQCAAFTMDQVAAATASSDQPDASKAAGEQIIGNFLPLQVLTIFGLIASIIALCAVVVYGRTALQDSTRKCSGVLGACLWIASGILLIAAVGYEANQYATFKRSMDILKAIPEIGDTLDMSVHFPWAAAMTGKGALMCFLNGLLVAMRMCYADKAGDGVVGNWNRFTNQA